MKVRAVYQTVNPFSQKLRTACTEWKIVPDDADMSILEVFARGEAPIGYIFLELEVVQYDDAKVYGDKYKKAVGEILREDEK